MSKAEEKLKTLESEIQQLSKQLRTTRNAVFNANKVVLESIADFHKATAKLSEEIALISEASLRDIEKRGRRTERRMFFKGLAMGLLLGIVGNMLVSYFMEYLKTLGMPSWGWALGVISAFVVVLCLVWQLDRESRRQPE